jgi:hypothetical protein
MPSSIGNSIMTGGPSPQKYGRSRAYLRAAQAYMLISMPTGTSTIFGVFQAISDLLSNGTAICRTERNDRVTPEIAQVNFHPALAPGFDSIESSGQARSNPGQPPKIRIAMIAVIL